MSESTGRRPGSNTGHGWVWPRSDGAKARCGGPGICRECALDAARVAPEREQATEEMLGHYSAALDEIHRLRQALAVEAEAVMTVIAFKTLPLAARAILRGTADRLVLAGRGHVQQAYAEVAVEDRTAAMRAIGAPLLLTRTQWEERDRRD